MKNYSFRSIITLTLVLIIGTISFTAFSIYSNFLSKKIYTEAEKNIISTMDLLKDQFYYTIDEHDGRVIDSLLLRMNKREQVLNSYLFNSNGKLMHISDKETNSNIPVTWDELSELVKDIDIKSFQSLETPFSRAYISMPNSPSCYKCHAPEQKNLGYIVIDISMAETESNIAYIRKASLFSTIAMVFVIIGFVIFMHYKFIRKSLLNFHETINAVNHGNLYKRLSIPETKELGILGKDFNEMLDNFQKTMKELKTFHNKELRNKYKLATIGEMAARLAHEIRNPITGIANAIEIIVSETNDEQNIPILEEIQRQAKRVNHAVSDVLKYSRKKDLNLEMNDLNETIKSLVFFLKNQVHKKEIHFNLELQNDIPLFRFDHQQMEDVMLNLGLNAIQATPNKGSITFKTSGTPSGKTIHIYVVDNGKGIKEDDISKLFHPFFTTRNEGTGLGLAIVKDIIDKHDGDIWAENNKTSGCTFTISLPVTDV